LAFSETKKEMVAAATAAIDRAGDRTDRTGQLHRAGPIHLFTFLKMDMSDKSKQKETMLVITVGFLVLYMVFSKKVLLTLSLSFGLVGILSPWLSGKVHFCWNKLSLLLGKISNAVLLTLIFFLVVTPVGLFRRWFSRNHMTRSREGLQSNFTDRDHSFTKKDLENTW
jgi:hypothetical protein